MPTPKLRNETLTATPGNLTGIAPDMSLWRDILTHQRHGQRPEVHLTSVEWKEIQSVLAKQIAWDPCTDDREWLKNLRCETLPISPNHRVLLVEAGPGCARSGQGNNGAMWLIQMDQSKPAVIIAGAGLRDDFSGYIFSVEPNSSHGYRDVVVGWHMSAFEAKLTYFRFNGKSYTAIAHSTLHEGVIEPQR